MYARSSTWLAGPEQIDAGVAFVREAIPNLAPVDGFIGESLIVDRQSGRYIATSAWRTEDEMHNSEKFVGPLRTQMGNILGAQAEIEEWEIAAVHRDHRSREGACAIGTWLRVDPSRLDQMIDVFKLTALPALEELEGFCSASLLVNRETGRTVSTVAFDSMAALERNRMRADALRAAGIRESGAEVVDVSEFELMVAHLHVPELV